MGRQVKKLSGLEIDEVSLVDRPANQHGLVAIAKREDDDMPDIFDADGNGVDEENLEHGDVVYDEAGEEFVFIEDGADEEEYDEAVGKAAGTALARTHFGSRTAARASGVTRAAHQRNSARAREFGEGAGIWGRAKAVQGGMHARAVPGQAQMYGASNARRASEAGERVGQGARHRATAAGMQYRAIPEGGRKAIKYGSGGAALVGAGGVGYNMHKSLGDQVLEELSKSFTDNDRDEVIAKAMDYMETIAKRSEELEELVLSMQEQRESEDFVELAKGYELPIDPEGIGGLMHRASQSMDAEDVATLDRLFSAVGEISKNGGFDQIGYDGYAESDVLGQVYAVAGEAISKADSSLTQEQAVTALFSANPDAYDEYESEQRYNR